MIKRWRIYLYLGFLISNLATLQATYPSQLVQEKMKLIDSQDLIILKDFFQGLFFSDSFAYTLFGPKPMADVGSFLDSIDISLNEKEKWQTVINFVGWKTWQRYAHLFPSSHFCFLEATTSHSPNFFSLILINKERCRVVIEHYLPTFQTCFGHQKTVDELLQMVCSPDFLTVYNKKEGFGFCVGLLFGYGKRNSQAFERRNLLMNILYQVPYDSHLLDTYLQKKQEYFYLGLQKKTVDISQPQPLTIHPIIAELKELKKSYKPISLINKSLLCPISTPVFIAFEDDEETKALQQQYESIYQKIVDVYTADNFLEIVLTQLSS